MKKILIFRTAPIEVFARCAEEYANEDITVIVQRSVSSKISDIVTKIIVSDKRLSLFSIGIIRFLKLLKFKYDKTIILVNNEGRLGYFDKELIALLLRTERIEYYNKNGKFAVLKKRQLIKEYGWLVINRIILIVSSIYKILINFFLNFFIKKKEEYILYLSNAGIDEPIVQSQSITPLNLMVEKGFNFFFVSPEKTDIRFNYLNQNKINDIREKNRRIDFISIPYENNLFFYLCRFFSTGASITVSKKCRVVHCRNMMPAVTGLFLKYLFSLYFIFDLRGLWVEERETTGILNPGAYNFQGYLNLIIMKLFYRLTLKFSDEIYVITESMKKYIVEKYTLDNNKISVIPTAITSDRYLRAKPYKELQGKLADKIVFGYNGSLVIWQQIDKILEFFSKIERQLPQAFFFIITMDDIMIVRHKMEQISMERNKYIAVNADFHDVPKYLKLCDFGILFRDKTDMNKIAFPTKIGEYFICGVAPIVSDGLVEVVKVINKYNSGLSINIDRDITIDDNLKNTIITLKEDAHLKQRCQNAAIEFCDWNAYTHLYEKSYTKKKGN